MALGSVENGQVQADGEGLLVHHLHLQDMDGLSGHFDLCQEPQQCRGNCKELGEGFQQPTSITIKVGKNKNIKSENIRFFQAPDLHLKDFVYIIPVAISLKTLVDLVVLKEYMWE